MILSSPASGLTLAFSFNLSTRHKGAFCHWALKVNLLLVLCRYHASVRDSRAAITSCDPRTRRSLYAGPVGRGCRPSNPIPPLSQLLRGKRTNSSPCWITQFAPAANSHAALESGTHDQPPALAYEDRRTEAPLPNRDQVRCSGSTRTLTPSRVCSCPYALLRTALTSRQTVSPEHSRHQ